MDFHISHNCFFLLSGGYHVFIEYQVTANIRKKIHSPILHSRRLRYCYGCEKSQICHEASFLPLSLLVFSWHESKYPIYYGYDHNKTTKKIWISSLLERVSVSYFLIRFSVLRKMCDCVRILVMFTLFKAQEPLEEKGYWRRLLHER